MNTQQHYFSEQPESRRTASTIMVTLAGADRELTTSGGVFSPGSLDRGTQVLLQRTPPVESGPVLDMGCGWGPIALQCALEAPTHEVWAVDVNERARDLTRENAARLGLDNVRVASPDEVPESLRFREIRSNPPIRIGKAALHELLLQWMPRLAPGGVAYLVVAKHLGADSLQRWLGETFPDFTIDRYARDKGFHIIRAVAA